MNSRRSPGKQKRTKSERQDCIDSLGVLSSFYGKKEQSSQKKKDPEADYAASLLVGRTFQYVTRKGERKNYVIRSYLPWNGTHRVQRCGHNGRDREYKTKVIDLEELPNIRWLDVDENDANIHTISPIDFTVSNDPNVEETTEERKRKRDHQVVSPPMKKNCLQAKDLIAPPPSSPPLMDPSQAGSRKKRNTRTTKEITTTTTTSTTTPTPPSTTREQTREDRDASVLVSDQTPPLPNFTRNISDSSASVAQDEQKEKKSTRSSPYNGVSHHGDVKKKPNRKNRWRAVCNRKTFLCSHGKCGIGSFETEIDAAGAFDDAIRKHLNGVERLQLLNFPTPAEKEELARSGETSIAKRARIEKKDSTTTNTPAAKSSLIESKAPQRTNPLRGEASKPSSKSRRLSKLSKGDRIAFEFSGEKNVHFGTVTKCGIGDYGQDQTWTISLDIGEIYELDSWDVTEGLDLYEKILENEKPHPLPKKASPSIGDRTAFGFGVSGIHFGCIKNRVSEKGDHGKEHQKWTVEFDDGEVHKFDTSEINNGLELYRRIREGKEARALLGADPPPDKTASDDDNDQEKSPTVPTRKLLGMARGDRIAFDFGTAGVYFGSIEESHASCSTKRKDWWWDIAFDDGDRYKFDAFEMARGVALYAKIRESERNDPKCEEKVRQWKKEHLAEKKMVDSRLSKEAKNRFLEVGFARWGKTYLPVLFLGPYHVCPGSVREQWLGAFSKAGGKGKIPQIVYWFGVAPDKGFSILEESDCLSLAEGKKQGLLQMKDTKSKAAEKHNHALHKLKECLRKPKESRPPLGKVREVHERVWGPNSDRLLAEFEAAKEHGWSGWVSD